MSTSLSLRGLTKRYGAAEAVTEFSLEVGPGEFVTLLGPSGSGKTTVLKMIAGFERPSAGDILIDRESVAELPSYLRGVGMVFQQYALFPHMTVFDNVAFPLTVRGRTSGEASGKVRTVLELVRLEGLEARYPGQLSGGQQQRVALARAVVFDPKLLLMDEPLGALDRHLREQMKAEIKRVQRELAMTVVYVTHDQDEALAMSDRVAVMREGRLMQVASPQEIYHHPADSFVARFVGESNVLKLVKVDQAKEAGWVERRAWLPLPRAAGTVSSGTWLLIRPERVRLLPPGTVGGDVCLEGRVTDAVFLGEATRYRIAVAGIEIVAKARHRPEERLAVDTPVTLTWSREDSLILPE